MTQENQEDEMLAAMQAEGGEVEMDQGDIDALLGDSDEEKPLVFRHLEEEIIHRSMTNYEKLPMLDVIADRLVMSMTNSLKGHTSAAADISIRALEYGSYEEAISQLSIPSLLNVVHADPWNGNILVSVDAKLLYAALEIQLGGRKSEPARVEGRNFTPIEIAIGRKFSEVILRDFAKGFSQLTEVSFDITSTETNPQFAAISQPSHPAVRLSLEVSLDGRKGKVDFVIPYATLEPVRGVLSKVFLGEKLGGDKNWQEHIRSEVVDSVMKVRAVLHEGDVPMDSVLSWKVGDVVDLQIPSDRECTLYSSGVPLCRGRMGRSQNNIAVRTTEVINKEVIE